jgi:hypothetical protein
MPLRAVAVEFGSDRETEFLVSGGEIQTFEDGSFVIVHKSGFPEVFTRAKKIFVVSAKKGDLGLDSEMTNP